MNYCKHKASCSNYWYCDSKTNCYQDCRRKAKLNNTQQGVVELNFYKLKKWKEKRKRILRRDEYLYQECKRYGKDTPATTVHHIIPHGA